MVAAPTMMLFPSLIDPSLVSPPPFIRHDLIKDVKSSSGRDRPLLGDRRLLRGPPEARG
jgi:hypothetical protein